MTANLTALGDNFVVQVSDRRLTQVSSSGAIHVEDDNANKAVVFSCSDSLLAVTFAGLGRFRRTRVDDWLLSVLQEEALCELDADIAVERFSELATEWFRSFRSIWTGLHTFVFAGFQKRSGTSQPRARLWLVSNAASIDHTSFAVGSMNNNQIYFTGWLPAFTRPERRRVQAACKKARTIEQMEAALVHGIRTAASHPKGAFIGKSCMSISLAPNRTAISRFHPFGENPHNFAPHFVWYDGGRNFAISGIDYLPSGPYSVV